MNSNLSLSSYKNSMLKAKAFKILRHVPKIGKKLSVRNMVINQL